MDRDNFNGQAVNGYYQKRYSTAWKDGTAELFNNRSGNNQGKHSFSTNAVAAKYNQSILSSPNDKKLKRTTIRTAVQEGKVGVSPKKKGRPRKIPAGFTKACVNMLQ